jgi:hypothetical protein
LPFFRNSGGQAVAFLKTVKGQPINGAANKFEVDRTIIVGKPGVFRTTVKKYDALLDNMKCLP